MDPAPRPAPVADAPRRGLLASPWPVRVGLACAVLVYVAYALFGIASPFLWGHHGYQGSEYSLRALNTIRFHVFTPYTWSGFEPPPLRAAYLHHPIGYHYFFVPFIWLLGKHEWVTRGVVALGGLGAMAAVYYLVRRYWSRESGLLAVLLWVALPFNTQSCALTDPLYPTMAIMTLLIALHLRYGERPTTRVLWTAAGLCVAGGLLLWSPFYLAFFLGVFALLRWSRPAGRAARLLGKGGTPTRWNAALAWFVTTGSAAAATLAFHFIYTWKLGKLSDLTESYGVRRGLSVSSMLGAVGNWSKILFGWPFILFGCAWIVVFFARVILGRARRRDQALWVILFIKALHFSLFPQEVYIHEHRIDWLGLYVVLATTDLFSDFYHLLKWTLSRFAPPHAARAAHAVWLITALAFFAADAPRAYGTLLTSRVQMGTDNQPHYNSQYTKFLFADEASKSLATDEYAFVYNNIGRRIEFYYHLDRNNVSIGSLSQLTTLVKQHPRSVLLMEVGTHGVERDRMLALLREHPARLYDGRYLLVDLRQTLKKGEDGLQTLRFEAQPMSRRYRYFVSFKYPPMLPKPEATPATARLRAEIAAPPKPPHAPKPPPAGHGKTPALRKATTPRPTPRAPLPLRLRPPAAPTTKMPAGH